MRRIERINLIWILFYFYVNFFLQDHGTEAAGKLFVDFENIYFNLMFVFVYVFYCFVSWKKNSIFNRILSAVEFMIIKSVV